MKVNVSKKKVRDNYSIIIKCCSDCLNNLLRYEECHFYNKGLFGINGYIYTYGGIALVIGNRPFGTVEAETDKIEEYERQAKVINKSNIEYAEQKQKVHKLFVSFMRSFIKK